MSIRPIDVVTMPPKSQEASNQHQGENHRLVHAQEQAQVYFNKEIKHNTQKTVQTAKKNKQETKYDAREKGNGAEYKNQQGKKEKRKDEERERPIKISNFDITI